MSGPSRGWIRQTGARLTGFLVLACSLALGACTSLPRTPYTAAEASTSRVLDIDGLRRYADEPVTKFSFEKDTSTATKSYLALSGGGAVAPTASACSTAGPRRAPGRPSRSSRA